MKRKNFLIFALAAMLCAVSLFGCGSSEKAKERDKTSENQSSDKKEKENKTEKPENSEADKSEETPKEKVYLTEEEIEKAYSNPDAYSGKYMKISGQIFGEPETDGNSIVFQMYGDPNNQNKNTVVAFYEANVTVNSDDYVIVDGMIEGAFNYENAFGGSITALQITAQSVEKSSYADAVDPAKKVVEPNMPIQQNGYTITLQKVEFTDNETRVYIKVTNAGSDKFNFYDFNAKIVQNGKQYEKEYNFSAGYPEIQSELLQGTESEGIIPFSAIDPNAPFQVYCEARSGNWNEDFEPFVFDVTP